MSWLQMVINDWRGWGKVLWYTSLASAFLVSGARALGKSDDVLKLVVGCTFIMPFHFVNSLIVVPRENGELGKLLSRSTPAEVISMKYVSALSMTMFVVSIPAMMLHDVLYLVHINCTMMLLAAFCMALAVVVPRRSALLIAVLSVTMPYVFLPQYADRIIAWFAQSPTAPLVALCAIPLFVFFSTIVFNIEAAKLAKSPS